MINLSEPIHVMSDNTLNLHGHQINRSQDIIISYIIKAKSYIFIYAKTWHVSYF